MINGYLILYEKKIFLTKTLLCNCFRFFEIVLVPVLMIIISQLCHIENSKILNLFVLFLPKNNAQKSLDLIFKYIRKIYPKKFFTYIINFNEIYPLNV